MSAIHKMRFLCGLMVICSVYSGEITVVHSPSSLRFGFESLMLRNSDVDNVLAASLGYTPSATSWKGLTVTSPFHYPMAAVLVSIEGAGASVQLEGTTYGLKEDTKMQEAFMSLTSLVGARAQRPTHFQNVDAELLMAQNIHHLSFPSSTALEKNVSPDARFLKEMSVVPYLTDVVKEDSAFPHGGQDIIHLDIKSFAEIVKTYGKNSKEVSEASEILRNALNQAVAQLKKFYSDDVIVVVAILDASDSEAIVTRQKRQAFHTREEMDYNFAKEYTEDFPAIFNIVLILSIILIASLIAISIAMAFMDPGKDSIIYRMTNPRMKKDQ